MLHSLRANCTKVHRWTIFVSSGTDFYFSGTCIQSGTGPFLTLIGISYYLHHLSSHLWNEVQWPSSFTLSLILPSETYLFPHMWNVAVNISNDITRFSVQSIVINSISTVILQVDVTYPNSYLLLHIAHKNSRDNS